jgi:hypothetical protein
MTWVRAFQRVVVIWGGVLLAILYVTVLPRIVGRGMDGWLFLIPVTVAVGTVATYLARPDLQRNTILRWSVMASMSIVGLSVLLGVAALLIGWIFVTSRID